MRYASHTGLGRLATRLAAVGMRPYYARRQLAKASRRGYVSPSATISHNALSCEEHVFIDDRVLIYQDDGGGAVTLDKHVRVFRDTIIQTGQGGSVTVGAETAIQPRCQFSAYLSPIRIGRGVQIAPNCAFYPYDHGMRPGELIRRQPLTSVGGIIVEDDAWLGVGAIVLDGVTIGEGAVVGAGAVVTADVPAGSIVAGTPARVLRHRTGLI